MTNYDILIPTAVMALLRGDDSVRGIADRFGVTECEVLTWRDLFVVAGVVALTHYRRHSKSLWPQGGPTGTTGDPCEQSTSQFAGEMEMWAPAPTTTPLPEEPTPEPDPDVHNNNNFNRTNSRPTSRRRQAPRAPRPARRHK